MARPRKQRHIERLGSHLQALIRYPGRSILTMLGLAIGVAAFIAMVSFGEGAKRSVLAQFEALGTNLLVVSNDHDPRQAQGLPVHFLSDRDVLALRRESTTLAEVMPVKSRIDDVSHDGLHFTTRIHGTTGAFAALHDWPLDAGGMFTNQDLARRAKVCVVGQTPLERLFAGQDALGASITVGGAMSCRVVGVLGTKGFSTSGDDLDDLVLVPITSFLAYLESTPTYGNVQIEPLSPALLDAARAEVVEILRRSHDIGPGEVNDFRVKSPVETVRAVQKTSSILSALLKAIAAVSLLVGGIGIMNIQLVSVAERMQEIGIRAAIGASPRQILTQFLLEALALTLVGAAIGVALGLAIAAVMAAVMHWPRVISLAGTVGSAAFAIVVGLIFGYLPARRAARLDPIEALRHE